MIARYITSNYEITDTYKRILIDAKNANVKIQPSSDDNTKMVFFEDKRRQYSFDVQDNILTIKLQKAKWFNHLRIGFKRSEIKICVPKAILETIDIKTKVGSVDISSIVCDQAIGIKVNTGKVNIQFVTCKVFNLKVNTATAMINKLLAKEKVAIKSNTGNVSLTDCNSHEFFVKTNTGSVCGKLPSGTVFNCTTNTGKIITPQINIGEVISARCEIRTNTGSIKFE